MLGMFLAALDQTIVSTPLYGKLGDMLGRKPVFLAAILIFLAGSMLAGLSRSMGELIGFRALQGIGAGGLLVGAQAIIADIVPPRGRGLHLDPAQVKHLPPSAPTSWPLEVPLRTTVARAAEDAPAGPSGRLVSESSER